MTGIAWRVESVRSFLTGGKPEITREMAITTSMEYKYSNEKLLKRLDFKFTPVEESIKEICNCYLRDVNASKS